MPSDTIRLPEKIDGWRLAGPPRRVDAANIFDYMNGAGELYLSYHFDHLLVYEYKNDGGNDILVELYDMGGSRDAFGLLSLDWGGETVELGGRGREEGGSNPGAGSGTRSATQSDAGAAPLIVPSSRALYGEGLLRIWSDGVYARILASREGPGVREVILRLGKAIVAERADPAPPELVRAVVGAATDPPWTLRPERTSYFYSHLVLNSLYYLSHENILGLGPDTEAVMVTFEKDPEGGAKRSARLLVIKYPDGAQAANGLTGFVEAYLPDLSGESGPEVRREGGSPRFVEIEDGWIGYRMSGAYLALALGCPDEEAARQVLARAAIE